ncbi:hypothetical protein V7183_03670 [Bacillus sp. JJ1127]|uniref:hypothetical protein n=1 Tax=Bacillus sp. JJ1127 TaxID=3122952 RepID=UPI002FFDCD36
MSCFLNVEQMQGLPMGLQSVLSKLPIEEPIELFQMSELDSICKVVIETETWRDTVEYDCKKDMVKLRDVEPLGECTSFVLVFE